MYIAAVPRLDMSSSNWLACEWKAVCGEASALLIVLLTLLVHCLACSISSSRSSASRMLSQLIAGFISMPCIAAASVCVQLMPMGL